MAPSYEMVTGKISTTTKIQVFPKELLEVIFEPLSFLDLIACLKVCRLFRDTIRGSTPLQKSLACDSVTRKTLYKCQSEHELGVDGEGNPYPVVFLPARYQSPRAFSLQNPFPLRSTHFIKETTRKLCPLLSKSTEQMMTVSDSFFCGFEQNCNRPNIINFLAADYFTNSEIWAPVYVTSPPVSEASLHLEIQIAAQDGCKIMLSWTTRVRSPGAGLTLGQLVDMTLSEENPMQQTVMRSDRRPASSRRKRVQGHPIGRLKPSSRQSMAGVIQREEEKRGIKAEILQHCWVQFPRAIVQEK